MRSASVILTAALLITASVAAWSQTVMPYTPAELDELLGAIALYPDPLLAQVLPAATYPDQLEAAQQLVGYEGGSGMIDDQAWDVSVKAIAHYPDVLKMMATSPDWTTAVGQAYVNQPEDVMRSIQRLRGKAKLLGYLSSNSYQTVTTANGYISIVPAQAQYIYVPTYNPGVVYVQRRPSYTSSIFAFGAGLLIGAWLNNAIDWNHHRVYYHGWHGGGWIGRSRSHVRIDDRAYVNPGWGNRAAPINRGVRTRDITNYRRDVKRNTGKYAPPGLISPRPSVPTTTRPRRPGARPGTPGTTPGVRPVPTPNIPGGSGPNVRPLRPGVPGAGPRPVKPRPGVVTPTLVRPAHANVPSGTRPGYRPGAGPHSVTPTAPVTRPKPVERPNMGITRPAPPSRPNGGAVRSAPSTGPNGARPSGRENRETKTNKQPK